jgi:hypothetical protein
MNCSSSDVEAPGAVKRTGVDATLREGAQISVGVTGWNVAGVIDGSTETSHVIDPFAIAVHAPIAGANVVASGYHSPTTPFGKLICTWAATFVGDQK